MANGGLISEVSTLHRFFARCGITRKKIGHAVEQDRPDVLKQRQDGFDSQLDLDPARLVFIDETWTSKNMTRTHGRCLKGERLRMGFPHGHRKTTTLVAGLRMTRMVASMVLDGPVNGNWSEPYVAPVLAPELTPGDVVVMDNLSSQKRASVREIIEDAGATLVFLRPYSHDFNPIEQASPALRHCCAKPPSAPSPASGISSETRRSLRAPSVRQLLQLMRLRCRLIGSRSKHAALPVVHGEAKSGTRRSATRSAP